MMKTVGAALGLVLLTALMGCAFFEPLVLTPYQVELRGQQIANGEINNKHAAGQACLIYRDNEAKTAVTVATAAADGTRPKDYVDFRPGMLNDCNPGW